MTNGFRTDWCVEFFIKDGQVCYQSGDWINYLCPEPTPQNIDEAYDPDQAYVQYKWPDKS